MPLKTTVIGAWPKPKEVAMLDWFREYGNGPDGICLTEENLSKIESVTDGSLKQVIERQENLGLDVITDGELTRVNYIHHFCRFMENMSFEKISKKMIRSGACVCFTPTIVGPLSLRKGCSDSLVEEWKRAQKMTKVPVKMTVPGPLTIVDTTTDAYYKNRKDACKDIIPILQDALKALIDGGCKYIQIDEPVLMRYPEEAMEFAIDNLRQIFQVADSSVHKSVHLCCGYPNYLDQDHYDKADKNNYWKMALLIDSSGFDSVSIEDAEAKNDLKLLQCFKKTAVILGSVKIARSEVQSVEEIKGRLQEALKYIPADRLWVSPDCGLGLLSEEIVIRKLSNMVAAAKSLPE